MSKTHQMILISMCALLGIGLVLVRQHGQLAFIELQEIMHQQQIERYKLNLAHIQYLQAKTAIPQRAKKATFKVREQQ